MRRTLQLVSLTALLALVPAGSAFAHAKLMRSTPGASQALHRVPSVVVLRFDEPVSRLIQLEGTALPNKVGVNALLHRNGLAAAVVAARRHRTAQVNGEVAPRPSKPWENCGRSKGGSRH